MNKILNHFLSRVDWQVNRIISFILNTFECRIRCQCRKTFLSEIYIFICWLVQRGRFLGLTLEDSISFNFEGFHFFLLPRRLLVGVGKHFNRKRIIGADWLRRFLLFAASIISPQQPPWRTEVSPLASRHLLLSSYILIKYRPEMV